MVCSPKIIAPREKRTFPNNCSSKQSFRMKGGMERLNVTTRNTKGNKSFQKCGGREVSFIFKQFLGNTPAQQIFRNQKSRGPPGIDFWVAAFLGCLTLRILVVGQKGQYVFSKVRRRKGFFYFQPVPWKRLCPANIQNLTLNRHSCRPKVNTTICSLSEMLHGQHFV